LFDFMTVIGAAAVLLVASLSVKILTLYFDIFFEIKNKSIQIILWGIYFFWQLIIGRINVLPAYMNVIVSVILTCMICIGAYEGGFLQKVVFSVLINAIWMLAEFLVGYVFILSGIDYKVLQFSGSVLSKLFIIVLIWFLKKFFHNENIRNLSNKHNVVLLLIPIGSMFVLYNIFMLSVVTNGSNHIIRSVACLLIVLCVNIIIFRLYLNLSIEKELQRCNTVYAQQLELCSQHMREKQADLMEFRNARHDIKQHFIVLMEMLDEGRNEEATEYLSKLVNEKIFGQIGISRTDNIIVDSLVNAKYSHAVRQKIKFEADIHIPVQLPFSGADICILIGNILDNAIEASMRLKEEERYIGFFMKYDKNYLVITAMNAFNGKLVRNSAGKIMTDKGEPENHGIGLESVRKIAEKYHGSVVIEEKGNFKIKVVLCDLPQKLQITS